MKRLKILYFVINANISFEFILLILKEHFVHAKGTRQVILVELTSTIHQVTTNYTRADKTFKFRIFSRSSLRVNPFDVK